MKTKNKNIVTLVTGSLLLVALVIYAFRSSSPILDLILVMIAVIAGSPITIKALMALKVRVFSIDLLVSIAVVGALIIGEFTEAAVVSFLFILGDYLEGRTLTKTRSALKSLIDMAPQKAIVLQNGKRVTKLADEVKVGDHIIVRPGSQIPVDGRVIVGQAYIDEAAITGESVPVFKREGDRVFSGTVSEDGYLEIRAEKVGEDTTFARIIELIEEAQEMKAPTQKFMERFASYYTPAIVVLSVIVGLVTQNTHLALTFLVIACPGALVISAPVSMVAGIGNGAKNGILFKGGDKVERLAKVDTVIFDKTGTLTEGRPVVTDIKSFDRSEDELLKLAAEVESVSEHHLAKAIVGKAEERGMVPDRHPAEVEIMQGRGLRARLDSREIYLGNHAGVEELGFFVDSENLAYLTLQQSKGTTPVLIVVDEEIIGLISIADKVREDAPAALDALRAEGINRHIMLTGDHNAVARKVGNQLEIDEVFAGLLPDDKLAKVKAFRKSGRNVAMVGDGVNDAPSMAIADVGIAMGGTATDITMQTADVILMTDNLSKLPYAIRLARETHRNMKQNTFIALITVMFLFVGVLTDRIHLASGMLIHEISVVIVIINAIRLVYYPRNFIGWSPFRRSGMEARLTPEGVGKSI